MKNIFKQTKVVFDAHCKEYQVYYRNFLYWKLDSVYKYDEKPTRYPQHYKNQDEARELSVERAKSMLENIEIYRGTNILDCYY